MLASPPVAPLSRRASGHAPRRVVQRERSALDRFLERHFWGVVVAFAVAFVGCCFAIGCSGGVR